MFDVEDTPPFNSIFQQRYGIRNDDTLDSKSILQPRLSFDWQVDDRLTITGGAGIFSGGNPLVWISNNYTNTGVAIGTAPNSVAADTGLIAGFDGRNIPQALQDSVTASAGLGLGNVNALDPDFDLPSVTRFSLGAVYEADLSPIKLGDGWTLGADLLYGITDDPVVWLAPNLAPAALAPDGRQIFNAIDDQADPDCSNAFANATSTLADGDCSARRLGSGDTDFIITNSDENPTQFVASMYATQEWSWGKNDLGMT